MIYHQDVQVKDKLIKQQQHGNQRKLQEHKTDWYDEMYNKAEWILNSMWMTEIIFTF